MAEDPRDPGEPDTSSRRKILKIGAGALGAGLAAIPLAPALGFLAHPLGDSGVEDDAGFLAVGKRRGFGGDAPVRVDLYADRTDAWNQTKNVKIGSAWVIEQAGALRAFSTVCPHAGCSIDFDPVATKFTCPCHRSFFTLKDGAVEEGPSPRPLDTLEVREEGELVAIRFQRFRLGVVEKVVV